MTFPQDYIQTDHALTAYCDAAARDIIEEYRDVLDGDDDRFDLYCDEILDRAHDDADSSEHVIYTYRARVIEMTCSCDAGEEFLDDVGNPKDATIDSLVTMVVYGEIRARIETELRNLIKDEDEKLDEIQGAENDDSDD